MTGYLAVLLRLTLWLLLTADLSPANLMIGIAIALLLPRSHTTPNALGEWLKAMAKGAIAIPQAYLEAIEIIVRPHNEEVITREPVQPFRTPGLIFLDIFLITFTPKTIVLKYDEAGWYEIHRVVRRLPP
jgi:multicomponent Na+:H+ antiporter subunit E